MTPNIAEPARIVSSAGGSVGTRFEGYLIVRMFLGLLLIVAAGLKAYLLATDPLARSPIPGPRWFGVALVEAEFILGAWLMSGLAAKAASAIAILGFSAFACMSLFKAFAGEESCGCFGRVAVSPWMRHRSRGR